MGARLIAELLGFGAAKSGCAPEESEDGAAFDPDFGPGRARVAVADGGTEALDAARWVAHLLDSMLDVAEPPGPAELNRGDLAAWLERVQRGWSAAGPAGWSSYYEEQKSRTVGSFATLLGCDLVGLDGAAPARWKAFAIGDVVLFHVRDERLVRHFPPLGVDDFGNRPDLVSADPSRLQQMLDALHVASGPLCDGDTLYVATDAFAHWLLRADAGGQRPWMGLRDADATGVADLVATRRGSGELRDDDVAVVRVRIRAVAAERR